MRSPTGPNEPVHAEGRVVELLLCSAGLGAMPLWLDEQGNGSRVVSFVDTAAQPLVSAPFVDDCRAALTDAGCGIEDLDLTTAAPDDVAAQLSRSSHVFVTGGHPVFLLEWAQRSGFLRTVRSSVRAGHLRYIGVSAGAALAGPSMEPLAGPDDPGRVESHDALGLVDFVVLPHVNRHPKDAVDARVDAWAGRVALRPLADDRAISVRGEQVAELASE